MWLKIQKFDSKTTYMLYYFCPVTTGQNQTFPGEKSGNFYFLLIYFASFFRSINFACLTNSSETCPFTENTIQRFPYRFRYLINASNFVRTE